MRNALLQAMVTLRARREPSALCTIVKTEGSTPLKAGAQMLVRLDGSIAGTIGGGALEHAVMQEAAQAIALGESHFSEHRLTRDHNMCCGGTVQIYIEFNEVAPQCFIFGAGHVGTSLASLLATLDFDVVLIDGRPHMPDGWRVAERAAGGDQIRYVNAEPDHALSSLLWDSNTYAIITTHSHPLDREVLRQSLQKPFRYCGMIGSKRKVIVTRKLFLERGWATERDLERIDMPIGLDIAASSPAEIAVSIAARMIEVKNRKSTSNVAPNGSLSSTVHSLESDNPNDFSCASATL